MAFKVYNLLSKQTTVTNEDFWTDIFLYDGYIYLTNSFSNEKSLYRIAVDEIRNGEKEIFAQINVTEFNIKDGKLYFISDEKNI